MGGSRRQARAIAIAIAIAASRAQGVYRASASRLLSTPLVSPANSPFTYNYNPALFADSSGRVGMLVRVQNTTSPNPYDIGPSLVALTYFSGADFTAVEPLTLASVVLEPRAPSEDGCGDEDPRATVYDGTLFVTFTAYTCSQPNLALATVAVDDAANASAYTRRGTLFQNSKSGSIVFAPPPAASVMLFGGGTVDAALSTDGGQTWRDGGAFLQPRPSLFDGELVEGGPRPLPLSDGSLFYLYNSDTAGPDTRKPGWSTIYHCGFAILNGSDPTQVLQRSDVPLFSPELPWELDEPNLLTPNVVFCEGLVPKPNATDTFVLVYGAADSYVGVGEIVVTVPPPPASVGAERLLPEPLISSAAGSCASTYCYSPALFQRADGSIVMLPRARNTTGGGPYDVGPSAVFASVLAAPNFTSAAPVGGAPVLAPLDTDDMCGCEDARVVFSAADGFFVVTYNGVECANGNAKIMLATATDPADASTWSRLGPAFATDGNGQWSKAGAMLLRPEPPHYLFHGDNSDGQGIHVAVSFDRTTWARTAAVLLVARADGLGGAAASFDSAVVEPGPPPVALGDGTLLFLYAGAQSGVPSPRPGWTARYCVGYAILNGSDPLQILERSPARAPLLCPELDWEAGAAGQYPNRVNVNGMVPLAAGDDASTDRFLLVYGAADTSIGVATLRVTRAGSAGRPGQRYGVSIEPPSVEPSSRAPACRNATFWPFDDTTVWNTAIGADAVYAPANLFPNATPPHDGVFIDEDYLVITSASDPEIQWFDQGHWNATPNCEQFPWAPLVGTVPWPQNLTITQGGNNALALLRPDGDSLVLTQPAYRCAVDAPLLSLHDRSPHGVGSLHHNGDYGGHGGSALNAIGGSLRIGELVPGAASPGPQHVLKIQLWAKVYYYGSAFGANKSNCFRWPALVCDGYSDDPTLYGGSNPKLVPGALLAVPPPALPALLSTLATEPAKQLAWTLTQFGGLLCDDTYDDRMTFNAEHGFDAAFSAAWGFPFVTWPKDSRPGAAAWLRDVLALWRALEIVDSNSKATPGGGGAPLQPPPPPFC